MQIFGIGDYKNDMVVRRVIDIKCQSLYLDWKCELHNHCKYLKEKKVSDLKSHVLYPCNPNNWVFMIENVWETEDWKEEMVRLTPEQSQPNVTNPLSEGQIFVKVLAKRSGYLKGYGICKNTKFLNAMPSQAIPNQEVTSR